LKDVADQPEASAASRVSLNILQDAGSPTEKRVWQKHLPKMAVALASIIILGAAVHFVSDLKLAAPLPGPQIQAKAPTKPELKTLTPSGLDLAAFSKPVQELMEYVQCLLKAACSFNPGITGEEAARQFGYSRLFASAYEEMILHAKARASNKARPRLNDIVARFEEIIQEEQTIDQLLARKERHAAAIAYLRALQNGDVVFPGPQALAPVPQLLLIQLMSAYPDASFEINDPTFAAVYRETREFASVRMQAVKEVWAQEIVAELRHRIVLSAGAPNARAAQTVCDQAQVIGEITVMTQFCLRLRVSEGPKRAWKLMEPQPTASSCRDKVAVELKAKLDALPGNEIKKMCEVVEDRVRTGNVTAFEITN